MPFINNNEYVASSVSKRNLRRLQPSRRLVSDLTLDCGLIICAFIGISIYSLFVVFSGPHLYGLVLAFVPPVFWMIWAKSANERFLLQSILWDAGEYIQEGDNMYELLMTNSVKSRIKAGDQVIIDTVESILRNEGRSRLWDENLGWELASLDIPNIDLNEHGNPLDSPKLQKIGDALNDNGEFMDHAARFFAKNLSETLTDIQKHKSDLATALHYTLEYEEWYSRVLADTVGRIK